MNHFYHREGVTDLQKMRDDSMRRLKDTPPGETRIHFHAYSIVTDVLPGQPIPVQCGPFPHEDYVFDGAQGPLQVYVSPSEPKIKDGLL